MSTTHDTPFTELDMPPRSINQPRDEADIRGWDYSLSATDDEYLRAVAYRVAIEAAIAHRRETLRRLIGDPEAYRSLVRKTLPLSDAPAYVETI